MGRIYDSPDLGAGGAGSGIQEAPADGKLYGRQDENWVEIPEEDPYIPPRPGEPGSTVFLRFGVNTPTGALQMQMGETKNASYLYPASAWSAEGQGVTNIKYDNTTTLSGTWALSGSIFDGQQMTCWLRVDNAAIFSAMNSPREGRDIIRNLRYSREDGGTINCEVYFAAGRYEQPQWHEFTANPADPAPWGREIFRRALEGQFGLIEPWCKPAE